MTVLALIPPPALQAITPSAPPATSYRYLWTPDSPKGEAFHGLLLEVWLPLGMGFSLEAHSTNNGHYNLWWNFCNEQGHTHTARRYPFEAVAGALAHLGMCRGVSAARAREIAGDLQTSLEALRRPVERRLAEWLSPEPCTLEALPLGPWKPLSL